MFDTQFYVCKLEKGESDSLIMNKDEFTDVKWLTVKKALEMEKNGDLPMLGPQLGILRHFADGPN